MSPQLQDYAATYRRAQEIVHEVADGLSDEAFNWKPSPKSWSVGECIVHLNKISKGYLVPIAEAAGRDAPRGTGPFVYGWLARRFTAALQPGSRPIPTGGPMKPPATTGTQSAIDKSRALAEFDADIDRFVEAIDEADGLDLAAIQIRSPFLPLLKLPLGGLFEALGVHAVRHAEQARRVTLQPSFPQRA